MPPSTRMNTRACLRDASEDSSHRRASEAWPRLQAQASAFRSSSKLMVACQSCCWCGVHLARRGDVDGPRELLAARLDSNNIGRWGKSDALVASSKLMVARSGRCTDFGNMPPHHCPASSVGPAVLNGGAGWAMSDWAASAQTKRAGELVWPSWAGHPRWPGIAVPPPGRRKSSALGRGNLVSIAAAQRAWEQWCRRQHAPPVLLEGRGRS